MNPYNHNITNQVNNYEMRNMQNNYQSAMCGPQNGVISDVGFQQNILTQNGLTQNASSRSNCQTAMGGANSLGGAGSAFACGGGNLGQERGGNYVSPLTGQTIPVEQFTHNNMVPFYGGSVKQSVDMDSHRTILGKHTGLDDNHRRKTEVKSFFDVSHHGGGHVNGHSAVTSTDRFLGHYLPSKTRTNELPTGQVRQGPLPTAEWDKILHRQAMPKTTDELKVLSKPKASGLEGRVKPGFLPSGARGLQGKVNKNQPERYYNKTPDMLFKNGGAIKAARLREKVYAKPTNRIRTRSYYGIAGQSENAKTYKTGAVRKTRRNNYMMPSPRNAQNKDGWVVNDCANENAVGDYGKNAIENKPNERDITQVRVVLNNLTSEVKKLMVPLADVMRQTRKENFIGNIRPEGNMKADMPSKPTVYDSNDILKTTIKETNIHNTHDGFLQGGELKLTVHDPNDVARTTIKETNIHNDAGNLNMAPQQPTSLTVYDPEDIPRTTLKETVIDSDYLGGASAGKEYNKGGYLSNRVSMRPTHKQLLSDNEYYGGANGDTECGGGKGYLVSRVHAKNTQRQFLSNKEYTGNAGFYNSAPISYSSGYNARLNPNKQMVSRGRAPTQQGSKVSAGGDKINIAFKKLEGDFINTREPDSTSVYPAPPSKNSCGLTTTKDKLPESINRDRMDADLLSQFNNNPYTQSLHSSA
jgi:hypothetical protein